MDCAFTPDGAARSTYARGVVAPGSLAPLELLYEADGLPQTALPAELARLYDGDLGLAEACVYANFVATVDGVVAIPAMPRSNEFIAGNSDADRFVMGLLRAFADAVLIGAGVLRASPRGTWRPDGIFPPAASEYAELRDRLGASAAPEVAVLTGSGEIDVGHPLLTSGALVLTSDAGAEHLDGRVSSASTVVALGPGPLIAPDIVLQRAPCKRPPPDPLRGRTAYFRRLPPGRCRRRAVPDDLAAPRRRRRARITPRPRRSSRPDARTATHAFG